MIFDNTTPARVEVSYIGTIYTAAYTGNGVYSAVLAAYDPGENVQITVTRAVPDQDISAVTHNNLPTSSYVGAHGQNSLDHGSNSPVFTVSAGNGYETAYTVKLAFDPSLYTVSGTVTVPAGPASGASVRLRAGAALIGSGSTAADGSYTISGVPDGTYTVEASLSGYVTGTVSVTVSGGDAGGRNLTLVPRTYTVSGTVTTDVPAGPASGASVRLRAGAAPLGAPVTAAADGTYTLTGIPDGAYTVEASLSGYATATVSVTVSGGDVPDGDLALVQTTVSGTISKSDGGAASGASVQLKAGAAPLGAPVTAAADGTYTVSGVPDGAYTVEVSLSGYATGTVPSFTVSGANAGGKNLTLAALYTLLDTGTGAKDLKVRFGISTSGAAGVTEAFNALHYLISSPKAGDDFTTAIQLGDWVDLDSLAVNADSAGTPNTNYGYIFETANTDLGAHGKLLRLIVVGKNSFTGINSNNTPHVVFQFQNVPGYHRMNPTNTNVGGYAASEMKAYLIGNFYTGLTAAGVPDGVVWEPRRAVWNGYGSTTVDTITDKLWLPTEWEMFDASISSTYENSGNQAWLEYYTDDLSRIKYNSSNTAVWYREASPMTPLGGTMFADVHESGFSAGFSASAAGGVAPAFCVK
jgi:hypothetical protein